MMNVYGLVVLLLVITAGITISYTFLFNINEIRVSGESDMYSAEEIVAASGIKEGDNLLRLDYKKSEQRILEELLYVETAKVDRDFPSSLEITVTRCIPAFNLNYGDGTLLVSRRGKILADNGFITDGLPIIYGFEPGDKTPGKPAVSENSRKNEAFAELIKSMVEKEDDTIATVDMSDEHSIIVNYKNGMVFKMGNWSDIEYKLTLAENVMSDENIKGKKGYLTMIGSNQCSFRTSDDPVIVPGNIEATTAKATDANGNPIDDNVSAEQNPEQEAIFSEFNNRDEDGSDDDDDQYGGDTDWNNYSGDWYDDGSYWNDYGSGDWGGSYWDNYGNDWNDYGNDQSWDDGSYSQW